MQFVDCMVVLGVCGSFFVVVFFNSIFFKLHFNPFFPTFILHFNTICGLCLVLLDGCDSFFFFFFFLNKIFPYFSHYIPFPSLQRSFFFGTWKSLWPFVPLFLCSFGSSCSLIFSIFQIDIERLNFNYLLLFSGWWKKKWWWKSQRLELQANNF